MDKVNFKPEPQLKKLWFCINWFFVLIGILGLIIMYLATKLIAPSMVAFVILIILDAFILWYIAASYRRLEYSVESDGLKVNMGVFWRKRSTVPYGKITNIDITQGPLERYFGISKIHIQTAGVSGPQGSKAELVFEGIQDCEELKMIISKYIGELSPNPATTYKPIPEENALLQSILEELIKIRDHVEKKMD